MQFLRIVNTLDFQNQTSKVSGITLVFGEFAVHFVSLLVCSHFNVDILFNFYFS